MTRHCSTRHAAAWCAALACVPALRAAAAQDSITLAQAVAMAQRQGLPALASSSAREAARGRDRAFMARLLPQVSLVGNLPTYNRSIIPVLQPDGTTLFRSQQQTDAALSLSVSQRLPFTGGTLSVTSALDRLQLSGTQDVRTWSTAPVSVSVRQDILRPNALRWDAREQDLRLDLAERQYLEAREDIALQATDAFFGLYAARTARDNAIVNAAINDTLYTLNKGRYEVGKIGENDLLQSELALLRARTSLDGALLEYEHALSSFRLAINVPPETPVVISVSTRIPAFDADTARAVAQALRNRSGEADLALQEVQARRRITEAKLNTGIGASVQASYGLNATGPDVSSAYGNLLEAQRFSLSLQVPLIQWGARSADVQAAQADRQRVEALSRSNRDQAALDARFAALQLSQARRTLALSAKADTVGAKRFEVAYNRYVIGRITIDNLYIAQNEKDQALLQEVQALRGYWTAYYRLRRVTLYDFEAGISIR